MNNANSIPWYCSVWAIILAFLIFWPLGIVLLILRSTGNKQSVFLGSTDKKKYVIAGAVLILLGLFRISNSTGMGIFMIAGGIALIAYADKAKRRAVRNRQYIDVIVNQGQTSLDNIASICNINYDTVVKELKSLVTLGVLKNAEINETNRTIAIHKGVQQSSQTELQQAVSSVIDSVTGGSQQDAKMVACVCPGCGAKVVIPQGSTQTCEYCDSPIIAK